MLFVCLSVCLSACLSVSMSAGLQKYSIGLFSRDFIEAWRYWAYTSRNSEEND